MVYQHSQSVWFCQHFHYKPFSFSSTAVCSLVRVSHSIHFVCRLKASLEVHSQNCEATSSWQYFIQMNMACVPNPSSVDALLLSKTASGGSTRLWDLHISVCVCVW